jgi:RimJ/RimL family protein N-acetyltransferase
MSFLKKYIKECTFIVHLKHFSKNQLKGYSPQGGMIGDVNLFLNSQQDSPNTAEVEIMIAEKEARGKGYGELILKLMIHYAYCDLGIEHFVCKIGDKNKVSQVLFQKMGFEQVGFSEYFQEIEMKLVLSKELKEFYQSLNVEKIILPVTD